MISPKQYTSKKKKISSLGGRRPQGSRCLKLWMFGQSNWQSLGPDSKLFHLFQEAQMRTTTHWQEITLLQEELHKET